MGMKEGLSKATNVAGKGAKMAKKGYDGAKKVKDDAQTLNNDNVDGLAKKKIGEGADKLKKKGQSKAKQLTEKGLNKITGGRYGKAKDMVKTLAKKGAKTLLKMLFTTVWGWVILIALLLLIIAANTANKWFGWLGGSKSDKKVTASELDKKANEMSEEELVAVLASSCDDKHKEKNSGSATGETSGPESSWLTKIGGSTKYADQIIANLKSKGWGGSHIAVVLAVGARESGLDPKADNPSGGVHGVLQWSNGGVNGDRMKWLRDRGGDIDSLDDQLTLLHHELSNPYYVPVIQTFAQHPSTSDADIEANLSKWDDLFEGLGGDSFQQKREAVLGYIKDILNHYPELKTLTPSPSLLNNYNTTSAVDGDNTVLSASNKDLRDCVDDTDNAGAEDGTGEVPADATAWGYKPDNVPDSLKKFIKDPEKLGLKYGGPNNWLEHSGQCVDLTESCGNILWGHSGIVQGHGKDQAAAWARIFGNSVKTKPRSGAIFSTPGGDYGHTGIVSHVFRDGSILVIEQNTALSGADTYGKSDTWNYRIFRANTIKEIGMTFAYPDKGEPKWTKDK